MGHVTPTQRNATLSRRAIDRARKMFLELSEAISTAVDYVATRKIFSDLSESRRPDRGIRRALKMFLDLSESSPAQASTTSTRKIFLELSGFWAIAGPLAGNRKMFLDLNGAGGSPGSQKTVPRAILRWHVATRVS